MTDFVVGLALYGRVAIFGSLAGGGYSKLLALMTWYNDYYTMFSDVAGA